MPQPYAAGGYEVDVPEVTPAPAPEPSATPEPVSVEATPAPESAPSQESGAPASEPAPTEPPAPAPSDPENPPADPPPPSDQLFELPDGRKVTAEEIRQEYMNLLPEFTRKSQRLAELEGGTQPITKPNEVVPEWKQEGYQAKSVAELVEIATAEAEARILARQTAEIERTQALAQEVDNQIAAIKVKDPTLNENLLFQHANKYGFTNLEAAHSNMMEMNRIRTETEQRTLQNVRTRETDTVAATPSEPVLNEELSPNDTHQYSSALDYLNRNK